MKLMSLALAAAIAGGGPATAAVYTFRVDLVGKRDFDGNALQLGAVSPFNVIFDTTLGGNLHGEGADGPEGYFVSDYADGDGIYSGSPLDAELMSVSGLGANAAAFALFSTNTLWFNQPGPIGPADQGFVSAVLGSLSGADTPGRHQEMNAVLSWTPFSVEYPKAAPSEATFAAFLQANTLNASFTAYDSMTDVGVDYFGTATLVSAVGVPEPQTWALLILGFGLAGGAMRRRRGAVI